MNRLGLMTMATVSSMVAFSLAAVGAAEFTYTTWVVPAETTVVKGMAPYFKRVEEETGGEFKGKIFTAGQVLGQAATLNGIRDRVVDSGFALEGWAAKEMPYNALIADIQYVNISPIAASAASAETYFFKCPECRAEYDRYNVFAMGGHSIDVNYLMCTKELRSLDDIKALRIRAPLRIYRDLVNTFGATPVFTSFPEMVPALQTGQAHCTVGNTSWMNAYGLKDMMKSIVTTRFAGALPTHGLFVVNKAAWSGLSPKVKASLARHFPAVMVDSTLAYTGDGKAGIDAAVAAGVKKIDLGEPFAKKWDEFMADEPERIFKVAVANGVKLEAAKRIHADYVEIYKRWEAFVQSVNFDNAKITKELVDRVYSKVQF